ncbi:MAG TPA: hypothetical protein VGK48_14450 [Terriglobia bacterium]|jgi:hypothetical protein
MRKAALFIIAGIFISPEIAFGQQRVVFELGFRAGVPTTKGLESSFTGMPGVFTVQPSFERPSFTAGPSFGAILYDRVMVQLDALYKPVRFANNQTFQSGTSSTVTRGGSWEFPLVFDYRFLQGRIRPYAGGGSVVGQTLWGTSDSWTYFDSGAVEHFRTQFQNFDNQFPAYVANAGLEWDRSRLAIRPELRYTRWDSKTFDDPKRRSDQFEILIGLSVR